MSTICVQLNHNLHASHKTLESSAFRRWLYWREELEMKISAKKTNIFGISFLTCSMLFMQFAIAQKMDIEEMLSNM